MPDSPTVSTDLAVLPTPTPNLPAVIAPHRRRRSFREKGFVKNLTIHMADGSQVMIPQDASANRAANQILIAQARELLKAQLKTLEGLGVPIMPQSMKELMQAVDKLREMSDAIFSGAPLPPSGPAAESAIGKMAGDLIRQAAQGLAEGSNSLQERMARIEAIGRTKAVKEAVIIDISAKPLA